MPDENNDSIVDQYYPIEPLNQSHNDSFPHTHAIEMFYLPYVIYPYTGAILKGNKTIRWTNFTTIPESPVNYSLFCTIDGGTTWQLLAVNLTTNHLIWPTLDANDSSSYILRIDVSLSNGTTKETYSNGLFSIANHEIRENTTTTTTVSIITIGPLINPLSFLFNPNIIFGVLLISLISLIIIRMRGKVK